MLAAMLMNILFNLLVLAGIEGVSPSGTRSFPPKNDQFHYHDYSHSLLVAVGLSLVVLLVYRMVWGARTSGLGVRRSWAGGLVLAVLFFSHWLADVLTHLPEMPILPGNSGELPTIGLELAAKPPAALVVEVIMAVAAVAVYFFWAKRTRPSTRWYVGPAVAAVVLALTVPFTV
jgi:phosphoglycerol transferase MdoB-like AlkP superfamily enzyme